MAKIENCNSITFGIWGRWFSMDEVIDYTKKWYIISAVAIGIFLATLDGSIVNIALPTLVKDLATDFSTVQWVVLSYLLTVTTLMLTIGRLADMFGRKKLYNSGYIIFTAGSVLCGLSPSIRYLIFFRVIQALGAAMIMALGPAIVTEAFPPHERGKALGITGSVVSIGIVVGPALGGIILSSLSWHWIFFVNLPVGIIGTLIVMKFIPHDKAKGRQRFDFIGALLLFISLMSFLLGLSLSQSEKISRILIVALFLAWLVTLVLFIRVEAAKEFPMMDLSLFRNKMFSLSLCTGFLTFVCIAGALIILPFYLENILNYSPRTMGFLLGVVPIGIGIMSPVSGYLSDRFGTRLISLIGLFSIMIGYYAASTLNEQISSLGYILRFLPVGIGMGIFQSPNNSAIMGAAPRNRLGIASGLLASTRTLGQVTGVALMGTIWAHMVAFNLGKPLPDGVTSAPVYAQVAGMHSTFLVEACLIALAVIISFIALRVEKAEKKTAEKVKVHN
jgi:EmrB/QacA subfamily drug resistance transporter